MGRGAVCIQDVGVLSVNPEKDSTHQKRRQNTACVCVRMQLFLKRAHNHTNPQPIRAQLQKEKSILFSHLYHIPINDLERGGGGENKFYVRSRNKLNAFRVESLFFCTPFGTAADTIFCRASWTWDWKQLHP